MKEQTVNQPNNDKIRFSTMAAYGAGGIIPIALFNIAGILVGLMGNISLGLSAFWLGAILIVPRLWDAISDPIIGHLSDNTRTRWGRRRPYLLIGGIAVALSFVIIWWIPKGETVHMLFPTDSGYQVFQLLYILVSLLIFFTAVNIFEIPHGALGMEMTTDYHERTRLFSAKSFVGNLFAMSTPWLFALASLEIFKGPGGNEVDGMRYISIIIAAVLIPLSFWWFIKLREPAFQKVTKQEKSPFWTDMKRTATNKNFVFLTLTIFTLAMGFNFVSLLGSYIPIFYIYGGDKVLGATLLGINGTIWAVTGVLAVFPLNLISPRLGKRKTLFLSILMMCLAQLSKIVCYNPSYPYLIIIPTVLLSAGMLFFFTLGSSMVGDICDEDELKTGKRSEGSFYSVFWWFIKMGTALASLIAGALIVFTQFDETQVTKIDKLQGSLREIISQNDVLNNITNLQDREKNRIPDIEKIAEETFSESKSFENILRTEIAKTESANHNISEDILNQRKEKFNNLISQLYRNDTNLHIIKNQLVNSSDSTLKTTISEIHSAALRLKLLKSMYYNSELDIHLRMKSANAKSNHQHYENLINKNNEISKMLSELINNIQINNLNAETERIASEAKYLTQQSPYTLLMMRVVEIGLPLLLSIFSILFLFRYSLTEQRSHEIKELLRIRIQNNTIIDR